MPALTTAEPKTSGLISTSINQSNPLSSIKGYEASQIKLDPDTDLVQSQVRNIVDEDSPLMKQAATRGIQYANKRGLLNSSMGAQAAQEAVIGQALPIAQQDASTYFQEKGLNQQATNEGRAFTANATNQGALQQRQGQQQIETARASAEAQGEQERLNIGARTQAEKEILDRQGEIDARLRTLSFNHDMEIQGLRGDQAENIAQIEGRYNTLLQASDSATRFFTGSADGITETLKNEDIPVPQKQEIIDKQVQLMEAGLGVIGGTANLDLTSLLDFS